MTDDKVLMLADTMRDNFDMSILDIPRHFVMREPQLFTRFDDLVIVCELTLQSLRDANRLSRLLQARNRDMKIHVVANRVPPKPDVSPKEFETGMEGKLRCVLPLDREVLRAGGHERQAADRRVSQAQDRGRSAPALHRARRRAGGDPAGLLQGPVRKEVIAHG
jgi:pilus assembly protein CpaE